MAASLHPNVILVVLSLPRKGKTLPAGDLAEAELWDHRWRGRAPGNSQAREAERKLTRLGDVALPLDGVSEPGS